MTHKHVQVFSGDPLKTGLCHKKQHKTLNLVTLNDYTHGAVTSNVARTGENCTVSNVLKVITVTV